MTDIRQSSNYASYIKSIGWIVEKQNGVYYFIKKIPVVGSVIKIQRTDKSDLKFTDALSKKYGAFQIILEPSRYSSNNSFYKFLLKNNFKLTSNYFSPSKTLIVNLKLSKNNLFQNLKNDARKAVVQNYNLRIKSFNNNLEILLSNWKKAVGINRSVPSISNLKKLKNSFGENVLALGDQKGHSGAIFLKTNDNAYYWYAFTDKFGRKKHYQYKLVWEGIVWAKKSGCKLFDFEGIYDNRFPKKTWLGFSHFKKSFGGKDKLYPGSFVKWRLPF